MGGDGGLATDRFGCCAVTVGHACEVCCGCGDRVGVDDDCDLAGGETTEGGFERGCEGEKAEFVVETSDLGPPIVCDWGEWVDEGSVADVAGRSVGEDGDGERGVDDGVG